MAAAGSLQTELATEMETPLGKVWIDVRQLGDRTIATVEGTDYADLQRLARTLKTLAEIAPEIPVILDIEGNVPVGSMVRVFDTCKASGFETVNFAAEAQPQDSSAGDATP